jgi:hypothetical protein
MIEQLTQNEINIIRDNLNEITEGLAENSSLHEKVQTIRAIIDDAYPPVANPKRVDWYSAVDKYIEQAKKRDAFVNLKSFADHEDYCLALIELPAGHFSMKMYSPDDIRMEGPVKARHNELEATTMFWKWVHDLTEERLKNAGYSA